MMTKCTLFVCLIACAFLFAVPALAADATPSATQQAVTDATAATATPHATTATAPVAAKPQVADASVADEPIEMTAQEMKATTGEHGIVLGSFKSYWSAVALGAAYSAMWNWRTLPGTNLNLHIENVRGRWELHCIPFGGNYGGVIKA